jgi:hypothetical protein
MVSPSTPLQHLICLLGYSHVGLPDHTHFIGISNKLEQGMKKAFVGSGLSLLAPLAVLAQAGGGTTASFDFFDDIVQQLGDFINLLVPVLIALALVFFLWGLVSFILNSGDETARDEGKKKMIWGIIALFIIVSVWGLVALLNQLTGVGQGQTFDTVNTGIGGGGGGGGGGGATAPGGGGGPGGVPTPPGGTP